MKLTREQFVDKLRRAFLMEEEMAGMLLSLSAAEAKHALLSDDERATFLKAFSRMHKDTERHKAIVSAILSKHIKA